MELFNRIITAVFNVLLWPLSILPPLWALAVVSIVSGVALVWVFGRLSNQDRITWVKDQIRGNLFGVRLYQHEIGVVFRLQRRILRHTATYMALSLLPMLVLMIPLSLIVVQLNLHFGNRPLRPGERAVVKVSLADPSLLNAPLSLETDRSFVAETPPVRAMTAREVAWRIRAVEAGRHAMKLRIGDREIVKDVEIGTKWGPVSSLRTANWWDLLLYPAEPRLGRETGVKAVQISYSSLPIQVFGWHVDWLVFFFVVSVVAGFALKGLVGVQL